MSFSMWYNKFEKNALLVVIIFENNGMRCICCNFNIYTNVLLDILFDRYIFRLSSSSSSSWRTSSHHGWFATIIQDADYVYAQDAPREECHALAGQDATP